MVLNATTLLPQPRRSYPQPDWLIDRSRLAARMPPRVRATDLWRVAPEWLEQAQDDATLLAIRDQELAGLDIITMARMRRESYSNRFATALEGLETWTIRWNRGWPNGQARLRYRGWWQIRRKHPVKVPRVQFQAFKRGGEPVE